MRSFRSFRALPLGLAAASAFAFGLTSVGPTLVTPAAAAEKVGSAVVTNGTLTINGSNGADVVALDGDATEARGHVRPPTPATCTTSTSPTSRRSRCPSGTATTSSPSRRASSPPSRPRSTEGTATTRITTGDAVDVIAGGNGNDSVDAGRGQRPRRPRQR